MLMAADLSCRLGLIGTAAQERVYALVQSAGLPVETPKIGAARARDLMQMDKKVLSGTVRLVLLEKLGRAAVVSSYPQDALDTVLNEHFA
jgi:3-dehydroquinate synthase